MVSPVHFLSKALGVPGGLSKSAVAGPKAPPEAGGPLPLGISLAVIVGAAGALWIGVFALIQAL